MDTETGKLPPIKVPRLVNPIFDIKSIETKESEQPFFGHAPAETTVRIITCPECGKPVSAAHIRNHVKTHKTSQQQTSTHESTFKVQTNSRLVPVVPCYYAERNAYAFKMLISNPK